MRVLVYCDCCMMHASVCCLDCWLVRLLLCVFCCFRFCFDKHVALVSDVLLGVCVCVAFVLLQFFLFVNYCALCVLFSCFLCCVVVCACVLLCFRFCVMFIARLCLLLACACFGFVRVCFVFV